MVQHSNWLWQTILRAPREFMKKMLVSIWLRPKSYHIMLLNRQIVRAACEDYERPQHYNVSLIKTVAELKYSGSHPLVALFRSANEPAIGLPSPPRHSYGEPRPHGSSTKASCRIQRCHWWAWTETDSPTESSRTRLQKRTKQCHLVREKQGEIWAEEFPTRTSRWTSPGVRMTVFFFPWKKMP